MPKNPGLAQLVARLLWEQDVGSSSLPSRTTSPEIERFQGMFSSVYVTTQESTLLLLSYIRKKSQLYIVAFAKL